jgi:hypothetical protein
LCYTPERFGVTLVGDFMDALAGFKENEGERIKSLVEVVRRSTTILANTQPLQDGPLTASELWPLPWDEKLLMSDIPEEERKEIEETQERLLDNM